MANQTDPFAESVHGSNPQYLIEKITRLKIYNSLYWKESCFGLTAETIIDKAIELKYYGGLYGGSVQPTKFLCLVLKLLQLQPEKEIILEFIRNEDFKYLRVLGAFYLRLTCKAEEIYRYLEPLYNDYRKLAYRSINGWTVKYMDEYIDSLLTEELVCDISLPHIPKRMKLEDTGILKPRESVLDIELEALEAAAQVEGPIDTALNTNQTSVDTIENDEVDDFSRSLIASVSAELGSASLPSSSSKVAAKTVSSELNELEKKNISDDYRPRREDRGAAHARGKDENRRRSNSRRNRKRSDSRDRYRRDDRNSDRGRYRESDRSHRDYDRDHRDGNRDRQDDDRGRRDVRRRVDTGSREDLRRRDTDRYRSDSRSRRRSDSRDRNRKRSSSYDRRRRSPNSSYSDTDSRSSSSRSRSRSSSSSRSSRSRSSRRSDDERETKQHDKVLSTTAHALVDDSVSSTNHMSAEQEKKKQAAAVATKRFDKIFGKKSMTSHTSSTKAVAGAPEGSVEYWNQMRESLGMKKLKE
jgi:pre-mRNA-splicing factor 38A